MKELISAAIITIRACDTLTDCHKDCGFLQIRAWYEPHCCIFGVKLGKGDRGPARCDECLVAFKEDNDDKR